MTITVYANGPPGRTCNSLIHLANLAKEAHESNVDVKLIYKGELSKMPEPPNLAVGGQLLGRDVTMEKLEEHLEKLTE